MEQQMNAKKKIVEIKRRSRKGEDSRRRLGSIEEIFLRQ